MERIYHLVMQSNYLGIILSMYRYLNMPYLLKKEKIESKFENLEGITDMINVDRRFKTTDFYEAGFKMLPLEDVEHKLFVDYMNSHYKSKIELSPLVVYLPTNKKQNGAIHSDLGPAIWADKERTQLVQDDINLCAINFSFGHYTSRLRYFKPKDNKKIYHITTTDVPSMPFEFGHERVNDTNVEEIPMLNYDDAEMISETKLDTCYPTLVSKKDFPYNILSPIPRYVVSFDLHKPNGGGILQFDEACDILKNLIIPENNKVGMLHDV